MTQTQLKEIQRDTAELKRMLLETQDLIVGFAEQAERHHREKLARLAQWERVSANRYADIIALLKAEDGDWWKPSGWHPDQG